MPVSGIFCNFVQKILIMFTASQKRKENIAEYLLYMWYIEDLIRANGLDMDAIRRQIVDAHTSLDDEQRRQMAEWYESLIDMMRREGVEKKGHLQLNKNIILDLDDLHRRLLNDPKHAEYAAEFYRTLPYIVELRAKSGEEKAGEIETCFNALYGLMMLRRQGREISKETEGAMKQISKFLATLAHYHKNEQDV